MPAQNDLAAEVAAAVQQATAEAIASQGQTALDPYSQWWQEFVGLGQSRIQATPQVVQQTAKINALEGLDLDIPQFALDQVGDYLVSDTGKIRFKNGVIADPESNNVLFPTPAYNPNLENVPGSRPWLLKVQEEWSDKKANEWRKKLLAWGYQPQGGLAPKGGMAGDLLDALRMFHTTRYLNYGKPLRMSPKSGQRQQVMKAIDRESLRYEVRNMYRTAGMGDPSDQQRDWWGDRVIDLAIRFAREGFDVTQAVSRAQSKVTNEFLEQPETELFMEQGEDQEENRSLLDGLLSVAQVASI